jgi:hypothetical protein
MYKMFVDAAYRIRRYFPKSWIGTLRRKFYPNGKKTASAKKIPAGNVIISPGEYYLLDDIAGTVEIRSSEVVLDLRNHSIAGATDSGVTTTGIIIKPGCTNIVVQGGNIQGHHYGLRADNVEGLNVERMRFCCQTFRGVRSDGKNVSVRDCRFDDIGGTTLYSDAYAMAIEINAPFSVIKDNIIRNVIPMDSGEGVGILLGYSCAESVVTDNLISFKEPPKSGRTFGVWSSSENVSICDNIIIRSSYGVEGWGAENNLYIDIPCPSYLCRSGANNIAYTGAEAPCPDDYRVASANLSLSDRNSLYRMAQVHHLAQAPLLSYGYFLLAAEAGSTEARDEAERHIQSGRLTLEQVADAQVLVSILRRQLSEASIQKHNT